MVRILSRYKFFYLLGILFCFVIFCFVIFFFVLPSYFSITRRVPTSTLIVEGWISEDAMAEASNEIIHGGYQKIITTGGPMPDDYEMFYSGKFVFICSGKVPADIDRISVKAFGDEAGGSQAHFKLIINDSMVGESYVSSFLQPYEFTFKNPIHCISRVCIVFDNDFYISPAEDRNLHVRSILIGNKEIIARNDTNFFCKGQNSDSVEDIAYSSQAYSAKAELVRLGINENKIIAVPAPKVNIYRTMNNARAFLNWQIKNKSDIYSFNVLSEGIHSRRSWIIYKNLFGKAYKIGVIAGNKQDVYESYRWNLAYNIKHLTKELVGNIYFRFIKK